MYERTTGEPAEERIEVVMSVVQILDLIREHRKSALEMAGWCKLNWPDEPLMIRGWTGRAMGFRELLESIPGTPEALELARKEKEHEEGLHRQIAEAEQAGWDD